MSWLTWRQFRLRTLLLMVTVVGVLLGGLVTLKRRARFIRFQAQVRVWTDHLPCFGMCPGNVLRKLPARVPRFAWFRS